MPDPSIADHERPLSKRGRKAAEAMRHVMRAEGLVPDLVLVSSAQRTMETLAALQPWDKPLLIDAKKELYLATADRVRSFLLIGHNPGMQELTGLLIGAHTKTGVRKFGLNLAKAYPTCVLAEFALTGPWSEIGEGKGKLPRFVTPRDLKAADCSSSSHPN
jgi:phosphohistidine phosphatase